MDPEVKLSILLLLSIAVPILIAAFLPRLTPVPECQYHDWEWTPISPGKRSILKCQQCKKICGGLDEWDRPVNEDAEG